MNKCQKNLVFDFYYCVQKNSAFNFLGSFFALFKTDLNSASNFAIRTPISNFCGDLFFLFQHFLLTLKLQMDKTAQKTKHLFYKCVFESPLTSITGLGGSILTKRSKSLYLNVHIWYMTKVFFVVHDHLSSFPSSLSTCQGSIYSIHCL